MSTETKAGALVAFGGFAQAIVYGMLAFAPLGQKGLAFGVYAGLASAIVGSLMGAVLGKAPAQFGGPRSSTALILAGSLLGFLQVQGLNNPDEPLHLLGLGMLVICEVLLASAFIWFAQARGLGKLMQFLPAPVLIGMNTTLGLFSAWKLLPAMLGFAVYISVFKAAATPEGFSLVAFGVSSVTVLILVYFRVISPNPLGLAYGLTAGLALHLALLELYGGPLPIQTVGSMPIHPLSSITEVGFMPVLSHLASIIGQRPELLLQLLVGAAVVALLVVLESMQAMLQVDQTLSHRHDTRRELNALALANAACGLIGALPSSNYFSRSNAGLGMGSRTRYSEGWYCAFLTVMLATSWAVLPEIPIHILATAVAVSSLFQIQGSTIGLLVRRIAPRKKPLNPAERFTLYVVLSMLGVTAMSNLLVGTLAGVLFVAAYFLRQQSGSGLRSIEHNPVARSRTLRKRDDRQRIDQQFEHLSWVRFDGNLFFGNAPPIAIRLQDELTAKKAIIFDFSQLRYIDDTAVSYLDRFLRKVIKTHQTTVVAVFPSLASIQPAGLDLLEPVFDTLGVETCNHIDDAFWWLESQLLDIDLTANTTRSDVLNHLHESHLSDGMDASETADFARYWEVLHIKPGRPLFVEGATANGLYVLAQGQMSAWRNVGSASERLMRFCPGSMLGEMALIDRKPRSATLIADTPSELLFLPMANFDALTEQAGHLSHQLMTNLARELALRIRLSNQSLALSMTR